MLPSRRGCIFLGSLGWQLAEEGTLQMHGFSLFITGDRRHKLTIHVVNALIFYHLSKWSSTYSSTLPSQQG